MLRVSPNFNIFIVSPELGAAENERVVPDTVYASPQCCSTPDNITNKTFSDGTDSDIVKNLFLELCLHADNNEFCECSVQMIEENIPVDEFPVEDLMSKILSGEISDETSNNDIVNLFPASVIEAVAPCLSLMIEDDVEINIEESDVEVEIESENLEILSKDELLKPLLEVCLTNQSEEFCKCTTETISENYSQEDLVKLRESVAGGELPREVFQLGLMNCAIYLGQ